ncbi:MAG: membrane protein insertion efficiency factor YidD [Dehalococcoidia bacterium]|jgi:putative membrane protein insertion efficiency factor|nr:membrane protein insertion efficiency factor YidD [Dehalococcoidia bacterium]
MTQLAMGLIKLYQNTVSKVLPPVCRFQPTCSQYAFEAIKRHGFARGSWLAAKRIARCNPFSEGGYDPVP